MKIYSKNIRIINNVRRQNLLINASGIFYISFINRLTHPVKFPPLRNFHPPLKFQESPPPPPPPLCFSFLPTFPPYLTFASARLLLLATPGIGHPCSIQSGGSFPLCRHPGVPRAFFSLFLSLLVARFLARSSVFREPGTTVLYGYIRNPHPPPSNFFSGLLTLLELEILARVAPSP